MQLLSLIMPVTIIAECANTVQRASFLCWCQVVLLVLPAQMLKNGHASEPEPPAVLSSAIWCSTLSTTNHDLQAYDKLTAGEYKTVMQHLPPAIERVD